MGGAFYKAAVAAEFAELDRYYRNDPLAYFAGVIRIKPKVGDVQPFRLKAAQLEVARRLDWQREKTGRVRALVLKGRQMGISTYVAARFFRGSTFAPGPGTRTYIMTHEAAATSNLFGMAKRMHENSPPDFRHSLKASNANELEFDGIESGYRVGTAGAAATGRSLTIQQFHGSEIAFWPNAEEHLAGALQAVPEASGTEIVLESTANGVGGVFYDMWQLAEAGKSEYIAIFLPWFWDEAYRRGFPDGYSPSAEEIEYGELYGLDEHQVCWMHYKNIQLGGKPGIIGWKFKQEYPGNATEAFQTSGADSLIDPSIVMRCRKFAVDPEDENLAPLILGVDIGGGADGGDETRILSRRGRVYGEEVDETVEKTNSLEYQMTVVDRVAHLINTLDPKVVNIDVTGIGAGAVARLVQLEYACVRGVNFGSNPTEKHLYVNKRAEMWCRLRDHLEDPGGAVLPDDDMVHRHLCAPGYTDDHNSRKKLESKKDIKKRLKFSPDWGDAAALTHAEILPAESRGEEKESWRDSLRAGGKARRSRKKGGRRSWMAH